MVTCYIDQYGDIEVYKLSSGLETGISFTPPSNSTKWIDRKLNIREIADIIPYGSKILLQICRDGNWYILSSSYKFRPTSRIVETYPQIIPDDYEVFAGICVTKLNMNQLRKIDDGSLLKRDSTKYKKYVVICQIFPETGAVRTQALKAGEIISKLNNVDISTLDDIRSILETRPETIMIETREKALFIAVTKQAIVADLRIIEKFRVPTDRYKLKTSWEDLWHPNIVMHMHNDG